MITNIFITINTNSKLNLHLVMVYCGAGRAVVCVCPTDGAKQTTNSNGVSNLFTWLYENE